MLFDDPGRFLPTEEFLNLGLTLVGIPNLPLQAVTNPCNWPMPFCLPRTEAWILQPWHSDYLQRLPIAWSATGLETGSSSLKVLCCIGPQPWTFFGDGCMTAYNFLTTSGSLITSGHSWWSGSIFLSYLQGGPQLPTPACRCLWPWLRLLHITPLLYPRSGCRKHDSFAGIQTRGLA